LETPWAASAFAKAAKPQIPFHNHLIFALPSVFLWFYSTFVAFEGV
jgi:hypothetical protein